jgi:hypothetical protein
VTEISISHRHLQRRSLSVAYREILPRSALPFINLYPV